MDALIVELLSGSRAFVQAGERILQHRETDTEPTALDQQLWNSWLSAAITLATLTCNITNPDLKAQGAILHELTDNISKVIEGGISTS